MRPCPTQEGVVETRNQHYRGEQSAAGRIAEKYGVQCSGRYIKSETEAGRLPVVIFAHQRWYAEADLDVWFASKRKTAAAGGAA